MSYKGNPIVLPYTPKPFEELNEKDFMEIEILYGDDVCNQYRLKKHIMITKLREKKLSKIIKNI